mgnify:CR=1 FL=1
MNTFLHIQFPFIYVPFIELTTFQLELDIKESSISNLRKNRQKLMTLNLCFSNIAFGRGINFYLNYWQLMNDSVKHKHTDI